MSVQETIIPRYAAMTNERLCDELGRIKARISKLTALEDLIKGELVHRKGENADIDGDLFHVNISTAERKTVDKTALISKLATFMKPRALLHFIDKFTKRTPVTTIRVTARLREG